MIVLLVLVVLLQLSFWADRKSVEVEGPLRIVQGPQDTLYIQIDRKVVKTSPEGDVVQVLDLDADAAMPEHVADFFVENDGRLLIARRDSQVLQYYSPEGKLLRTHLRPPSELVDGDHFCKITKDPVSGTLYFADTSHHRIQIYGPDEKEVKAILVPSGKSISQPETEREDFSEGEGQELATDSPDTALSYPNGLTFDKDRLIATDTANSRIVLFYPDGTLDKIIPVSVNVTSLTNPFRVSRAEETVYVVSRGPNFHGGVVSAFDQTTGTRKRFRTPGTMDPWDVFARSSDVLVADRTSLSVLRFSHEGSLLGTYGAPSLQSLYADRQMARSTFRWMRKVSLAAMVLVLGWLLFASRRQRIAHEEASQSLFKPVVGLQNFLGPTGSTRRKLLLLIPGLGQAAAGRFLRTFTIMLIFTFFVSLLVHAWYQYQTDAVSSLVILLTVGFMNFTIWIVIVLDGIRVNRKTTGIQSQPGFKAVLQYLTWPFMIILSASAAQIAGELLMFYNSTLSAAIQKVFSLVTVDGRYTSVFAALFPASLVFGWAGAAAAMFGLTAGRTESGHRRMPAGAAATGLLAGIMSWAMTIFTISSKIGWILLIVPLEGALLSLFLYLFFRRSGMPLLIIPAAIAGAWMGDFSKLILANLLTPVQNSLIGNTLWPGILIRIESVLFPFLFMYFAIQQARKTTVGEPSGIAAAVLDRQLTENIRQ